MVFNTLAKDQVISDAIVVDNSVMMRWLFKDGSQCDQYYAQHVLSHIDTQKPQVMVPYVWVYESSFVVNYYAKKGTVSHQDSMKYLATLFDLCWVIRGEETPCKLFDFANSHGLSTYDASYVILALQQKCALATLDKEIIRAAENLPFNIFGEIAL